MCVIPHLCHTQTAITTKITGHLVPLVLGLWYSRLWRALWRLTAQKGLNNSATIWNHKNQAGPRASETHGCVGNLDGRWTDVWNPVSSFFSVLLSGFPSFASQKPAWGFALTHIALQIHCTAPPWGFFRPYCLFNEPSCPRKALEDGTTVGNTGTEKGIARWTS